MPNLMQHMDRGDFRFDMSAIASPILYDPWSDYQYDEEPIPSFAELIDRILGVDNADYGADFVPLRAEGQAAPRVITYSVHSERHPFYNTSFAWGGLTKFLNFLGRYHNLVFTRNNAGRIRIIQANSAASPFHAAWVRNGTFDMRISPTYNFAAWGASLTDYVCAKTATHEFFHMTRGDGYHTPQAGLMDTSASMPTGNLTPIDCANYPDRVYTKTTNPRPWLEPNLMRRTFIPNFASLAGTFSEPQLAFGCDSKRGFHERIFGRRINRQATDLSLIP